MITSIKNMKASFTHAGMRPVTAKKINIIKSLKVVIQNKKFKNHIWRPDSESGKKSQGSHVLSAIFCFVMLLQRGGHCMHALLSLKNIDGASR